MDPEDIAFEAVAESRSDGTSRIQFSFRFGGDVPTSTGAVAFVRVGNALAGVEFESSSGHADLDVVADALETIITALES